MKLLLRFFSIAAAQSADNASSSNYPSHSLLSRSRRMLDSDPNHCLDMEGRMCQWADFSKPSVHIVSSGHFFSGYGDEMHDVNKAVDGNTDTNWISSRGSGRSRFWQVTFPEPMQFSMVVLHSDSWPAAYDILVDGIQCARMHFSGRAACGLSGNVVEIRLASDAVSATMSIYEVQLAHVPVIRRIICPFIATLVNERVLDGCRHTREELLEVTVASGLPGPVAMAHINANFANNPSGEQDVCDMEGAPNEHNSSTGINDCITDFGGDAPSTPNKDCGTPNVALFEKFFEQVDENGDNYLTVSELNSRAEKFIGNDLNPIATGSISGSFTLLLEIFGHRGFHGVKTIYRPVLKRLLIERRFPHGYTFGQLSQFRFQKFTFRSCAEVFQAGHTESGTYVIQIGSHLRTLFCEMASDGQWMLVSVVKDSAKTQYNKYPVNGENLEALAESRDEWSSLSEKDMKVLWESLPNPVMKLAVTGNPRGGPRDFYLQRTSNVQHFNPFKAIRYVPEWGAADTEYKICEPSKVSGCYDAMSGVVTHDGGAMKHWESHSIDIDDVTYEVSRHGIPGDHKSGCEWLYQFKSHCDSKNELFCTGGCSSSKAPASGYIYLGGADAVSV